MSNRVRRLRPLSTADSTWTATVLPVCCAANGGAVWRSTIYVAQLLEEPTMKTDVSRNATLVLALLAAGTLVGLNAAAGPAPAAATAIAAPSPPVAPVTPVAGSYDVGLLLGGQLEHNGLGPNLDFDALVRGLKDSLSGRTLTPDERDAATRFMHDAHSSLVGKGLAQGREFMERNAKQPGVVTLPSGLQYRVLAAGDPNGKPPLPTEDVTVRYRTSLADGTEIDNSDKHGQPATFRVNSVFKGWQEAFKSMTPGAKWELFVPPELGYGNNPPPSIPPGALLIYEIELLRVAPAPPMDAAAAAAAGAQHSATAVKGGAAHPPQQ
jgi:FKBP-type peptidyl-prolyl cis-trans isomerase FklB